MTTLLPVALKGIKTELVRDVVTSLCLFFNAIEQKVIDEEKLLDLKRRHFETLCLGLKAVELGRDNPNIVFTFTFEYENEIEFGKVGNENENEIAGYQQI
jgi:hypothetical protein